MPIRPLVPGPIAVVALAALVALTACTGLAPGAATPPSAEPSVIATALPAGSPSPDQSPATTPDATLVPPPAAVLVVNGREHTGRVGSWVWAGGSGSAPWLPAAALDTVALPAGAAARVEVAADVPIASWTARAVPAADASGTDLVALGTGAGEPAFDLPASGAWVVAVHLVFADGLGDAAWYWHVVND